METAIYTVNSPGGPAYILNNSDYWLEFSVDQVSGELYYELVNGRLCIKFHTEASNDIKYSIRDRVRNAVKKVYGSDYHVLDSGRLGDHMTACQIDHDFYDIEKFDLSAQVFQDIAVRFDQVIKAISPDVVIIVL